MRLRGHYERRRLWENLRERMRVWENSERKESLRELWVRVVWGNSETRKVTEISERTWVRGILSDEGMGKFWENEIEREFLEKEGVTGNLERKKESEFWDTEGEWQGMLREEGKTGGILRERRRFRGKIWKEESSKIKSDKEGGSEV